MPKSTVLLLSLSLPELTWVLFVTTQVAESKLAGEGWVAWSQKAIDFFHQLSSAKNLKLDVHVSQCFCSLCIIV